ncbi:amino acid ABC transporter permease [Corynebacterium sp. 320]|uniref:Amino acid ABC transporter permease n=1 Tax=Corynebacterium zhongnanshanii TaxID=2768834 RepID=A0ABQ6VD89_9CORY|nr:MULTISPECIES: amino acid ABC transporter permease [Corynebacterium]KAB1502436.1 amino acid ABC transporter permease [Corynebacterium sp. 320]KAB1551343.1 amino acid ABC transporter permease [Corynebacterium sp. 321]KAB1551828.1 amino acid ABC transporter permease [Corynebacterium sp. 319]KAB3520883.1 amino acid ABC transporter permease [Corynebacterium zhongnanshanii]KAB3526043.1 amino acid ABC transporter permease [Corynebacterium sp. 250]
MSTRATVLYDTPGPKGERLNKIFTVVTIVVVLGILALVGLKLNSKGQFESAKWSFFADSTTWTTYILPGLFSTIGAAVASIILAMVIGTLLGVGRLSPYRFVRTVCGVIVEFFRSIPVLVLMLFAYSAFSSLQLVPSSWLGFSAVVFGLTMYNGSVIAETLRSGIESLPRGQREAAIALGMRHRQSMYLILLPQAVAAMLPAIISQMVIALKDSALGYMIGFVEVVRSGRQLGEYYGAMIPALVLVAVIMILINMGLASLAERIERQLRSGRARRNIVAKVPQQKEQGLETKDNVNVDWHAEGHKDLRTTFE